MKRSLLILAATAWLFLLLAATGPALASEDAGADLLPVRLQLKWKHQFQFAGYYAAIEQGFYREEGLEVELLEAGEDGGSAASVLSGEAEFGVGSSDLVLLRASGEPVVVLAPIFQHSPLVLLAAADQGIENIHSLAGRKVMLEEHATELLAYLKSEGVSPESIQIVPHTYDPRALIDGEVAAMSAYLTDEPYLLIREGASFLTFNPRAGGVDFYGDTLFTTETLVKEQPEVVDAFLRASIRGWKYALEHSGELVELIYGKYSQRHEPAHLRFEAARTRQLILPEVVEVGYLNPGRWRYIAEVYRGLGLINAEILFDDFLYLPRRRPDLGWVYATLAGALGLLLFFAAVTLWTRRLNTVVREQARALQAALDEIRELQGIIPICSHCKKIREGEDWTRLEEYLTHHTNARFSHSVCAECLEEHYPEDMELLHSDDD